MSVDDTMSSRAETGVDSLAQPGTMAGMSAWQPIETAPKDRDILVGWWSAGLRGLLERTR